MTIALVAVLVGLAVVFATALYLRGSYRWSWNDPDAPAVAGDPPSSRLTAPRGNPGPGRAGEVRT